MPLVCKAFGDIITFTRASSATYFDSAGVLQTATTDTPRFDYNPATLAAQGFLIEEQRTNLFPASNDFANATYWTVSGTAVATAGAGTGPDGLNSAVNLAGATDTTLNGNNIEESVSVTASTAYEFSVFVKSNGGTTVTLRLRDSTGGSSSSTAFTVTSTWTRISFNRTMAVGATSVRCIIGSTNGDILIYGAQLEAGGFATSYIPTTTASATRSADLASVNTLSPWFNAAEGTLFAEGTVVNNIVGTTARAYAEFGNAGSGNERFAIEARSTTSTRARLTVGGVSVNSSVTYNALGTNTKVAGAYGADGVTACVAGLSPVTTATSLFGPVTSLFLGTAYTQSSASNVNGYLCRITYYPRRLSNAELQAITS